MFVQFVICACVELFIQVQIAWHLYEDLSTHLQVPKVTHKFVHTFVNCAIHIYYYHKTNFTPYTSMWKCVFVHFPIFSFEQVVTHWHLLNTLHVSSVPLIYTGPSQLRQRQDPCQLLPFSNSPLSSPGHLGTIENPANFWCQTSSLPCVSRHRGKMKYTQKQDGRLYERGNTPKFWGKNITKLRRK